MQSLELSGIIRSDVLRVQFLITFVTTDKSDNSNATLDQNYCKCDNVKFSIMKPLDTNNKNRMESTFFLT